MIRPNRERNKSKVKNRMEIVGWNVIDFNIQSKNSLSAFETNDSEKNYLES